MLTGVVVVEFAAIGPTPFCGMILADMGADVIRIDKPSDADPPGLSMRIFGRGKRSIVLDLKSPGDKALALSLAARADAIIEGMRPGVMERLGLGPAACHARNPGLVYGRVTGGDRTGRSRPRRATTSLTSRSPAPYGRSVGRTTPRRRPSTT